MKAIVPGLLLFRKISLERAVINLESSETHKSGSFRFNLMGRAQTLHAMRQPERRMRWRSGADDP